MTPKRVAIFWVHGSCPPVDQSANDFTLAINLREMCGEYGNVVLFKVYYGQENNGSRVELETDVGLALDSAGIVAVRHPEMGVSALTADALCFWADNLGNSCAIVFITANPTLLYTAAALKSRKAEVGFIVPPNVMMNVAPYSSWNRVWELARKNEERELNTKLPSASQGPSGNKRSIYDAPFGPVHTMNDRPPTQSTATTTNARVSKPKPRNEAAPKRVPQPLDPVKTMYSWLERIHTTVHDLQIPETEPLYIELIKDPKAMELKTWRRQFKQMLYHESAAKNPQAPSQLETLFSNIEKYGGMTRNYLAFSRIGKLMTQISQMHYQDFDYRRGYVSRAKTLLDEWEKLIIKDGT